MGADHKKKKFMESAITKTMRDMWREQETDLKGKVQNACTVTDDDLHQATRAAAQQRPTTLPPTGFVRMLGTTTEHTAQPQSTLHAERASEDWNRSLCENHAFAILQKVQESKIPYIKKEGRDMLVAMVLDQPLVAQKLVRDPDAFLDALVQTMTDKMVHAISLQMIKADVRNDLPATDFAFLWSAPIAFRQVAHCRRAIPH